MKKKLEVSEKEIKAATKELTKKAGIKSNVSKNTTTPIIPTTRYYIKSWGHFDKSKKLIIEQVESNKFIYMKDGVKGSKIVQTFKEKQDDEKKDKLIGKGFIIDGELFLFDKRIYNAKLFYNTPNWVDCLAWIDGKKKLRPFPEILKDLSNALKVMFEFTNELDIETSKITISQSWIKPVLDNFFFYGIDATKGGGKTTLGEIVYFLMRHGFMGGNISSAAIPRLVDELDLNIFVDEIDQNSKDEDIMAILRKGQRRYNPYVRCEGRDNHPVAYEVAGSHGFSYRTEIEDAFMDRALRTHTKKAVNSQLPIINCYKRDILKPLADELFFWFMENIVVVSCSKKRGVVGKSNPNHFNRDELFKGITKDLSKKELKFLKQVFGRDNELSYLCLKTSRLLGFDILEKLKKIIIKKKEDAQSSESFYIEELKEFINNSRLSLLQRILKEGQHEGCFFYPKNRLYAEFVKHLKEINVMTIGTKRFSSMLRDLGFMEGYNLTSQRYGDYPTACLIFTEDVCKTIGIDWFKKPKLEKVE